MGRRLDSLAASLVAGKPSHERCPYGWDAFSVGLDGGLRKIALRGGQLSMHHESDFMEFVPVDFANRVPFPGRANQSTGRGTTVFGREIEVTVGPLRIWRMPESDLAFRSFGLGVVDDFFPAPRPFSDFPMMSTRWSRIRHLNLRLAGGQPRKSHFLQTSPKLNWAQRHCRDTATPGLGLALPCACS
jgi:hypothetical protein